jgi:uncharacterized protein YqgC (DUF456 family)
MSFLDHLPLLLATSPAAAGALAVASLIIFIGFLGTFVPLVPGSLLVWLAIILYRLWLGDAGIPWWFVFVSGGLTLFIYLFDILCGAWGARKFGATWRGAVGALLGGVIGLFIPPPLVWLLLGPIIGAVVGELLGGRQFGQAGKAGFGTVVGAFVGLVCKLAVTVFIIGWFYLLVLLQ